MEAARGTPSCRRGNLGPLFSAGRLRNSKGMSGAQHQPGDLIIDSRLPHADRETRARARQALQVLANVVLGIAARNWSERWGQRDSLECGERDRIPSNAP